MTSHTSQLKRVRQLLKRNIYKWNRDSIFRTIICGIPLNFHGVPPWKQTYERKIIISNWGYIFNGLFLLLLLLLLLSFLIVMLILQVYDMLLGNQQCCNMLPVMLSASPPPKKKHHTVGILCRLIPFQNSSNQIYHTVDGAENLTNQRVWQNKLQV